jgi:hypothetical protein
LNSKPSPNAAKRRKTIRKLYNIYVPASQVILRVVPL